MNSKIRVDVWGRYRVVYLRDGDIWSSGSVRGQVDDYLNSHINYTGESRLVTRYTFEVSQEPMETVGFVEEKYRPYRNPSWGVAKEYAWSPLEFASSLDYLDRLAKVVTSGSEGKFMDIWITYFSNNRMLDQGRPVYVDSLNPNFVIFNQLSVMSAYIPWLGVEVRQF